MATSPTSDGPTVARLRQGVITRTPAETIALAAALTRELPRAVWLALHGDLGVGKTCFVGGLAKGFGIKGPISSPTFAILNIYKGQRQLLHIDAYRLTSTADADDLLVDEWLADSYCVAVEWPEKMGEALPADAWHLHFSINEPGEHRIWLKVEG